MKSFKFFGLIFFLSSIIFALSLSCHGKDQKSIGEKNNHNNDVDIIIISDDCPIKLYACLESIKTYVKGYNKIFVFYSAQDDEFEKAYKTVALDFCDVIMLDLNMNSENYDLRSAICSLILSKKVKSKYFALTTDDVIFKDIVDLSDSFYALEKSGVHGFSLSFGRNIAEDNAAFLKKAEQIEKNVMSWKIDDLSKGLLSGVFDMAIYSRRAILNMTSRKGNGRRIKDLKTLCIRSLEKDLRMASFYKSKTVKLLPVIFKNKLKKNESEKYFVDSKLLCIFNSGFKINISTFYGIDHKSSSLSYEVAFVPRTCEKGQLWKKLEDRMPRKDKHFVIVIASYNNKQWYRPNLDSVISQKYKNYHVIYTDDSSPDGTGNLVENYIKEKKLENKILLIKNKKRCGALENIYRAIQMCDDKDIIITLDGDDWFANDHVLSLLNNVYDDPFVWLTYGQYKQFPVGNPRASSELPAEIITENKFREYSWVTSHLRTFYAWLFKKINVDDLKHEGKFFPVAWDLAMMFPMLEMAGERSIFIEDVLYVYNADNILNDHKVDRSLQVSLSKYIRALPRYNKLPPKVLLVVSGNSSFWGGAQECAWDIFAYLSGLGRDINILLPSHYDSYIKTKNTSLKYYTFESGVDCKLHDCLKKALINICDNDCPDIIHCNSAIELGIVREVCDIFKIGMIAHYHNSIQPSLFEYRDMDGFIAVSPVSFDFIKKEKESRNIKFVELLPPFFNENSCKNFSTEFQTREEFFKKKFNLDMKPCPIICVIANLYRYKNHEILIKAMHELIKNQKIEVQAVFVGSGTDKAIEELSAMANELEINEYIKFLGFTDQVSEVLFFSDINVLPSKKEAFGIVLMEAALMKRPIILSRAADSSGYLIQHEQTGLLFDVDNQIDLANQIKKLIDNKEFSNLLVQNAYEVVSTSCLREFNLEHLLSLYDNVNKVVRNKRKKGWK